MNVTKFLFFNVSENLLSKRDFKITRREIFDKWCFFKAFDNVWPYCFKFLQSSDEKN